MDAAVLRFEQDDDAWVASSPAQGRTSAPGPTSRRSPPAGPPSWPPRRRVRRVRALPAHQAGHRRGATASRSAGGTRARARLRPRRRRHRRAVRAAGGHPRDRRGGGRAVPPAARRCRRRAAMELILTADRLGAEEAAPVGPGQPRGRARRGARPRPRAGRPDLPERPARRPREPRHRPGRAADRRRRGVGPQRCGHGRGCGAATTPRRACRRSSRSARRSGRGGDVGDGARAARGRPGRRGRRLDGGAGRRRGAGRPRRRRREGRAAARRPGARRDPPAGGRDRRSTRRSRWTTAASAASPSRSTGRRAQELVRRLADGADVFLNNLLLRRQQRFGLDAETLLARAPAARARDDDRLRHRRARRGAARLRHHDVLRPRRHHPRDHRARRPGAARPAGAGRPRRRAGARRGGARRAAARRAHRRGAGRRRQPARDRRVDHVDRPVVDPRRRAGPAACSAAAGAGTRCRRASGRADDRWIAAVHARAPLVAEVLRGRRAGRSGSTTRASRRCRRRFEHMPLVTDLMDELFASRRSPTGDGVRRGRTDVGAGGDRQRGSLRTPT